MNHLRTLSACVLVLILCSGGRTLAQDTPLIPRETFFGNPDRVQVKVSPDGKQISYVAPVNEVLNIWVGPLDTPAAAKPITKDTRRGITRYFWAHTNQHVLYLQDKDGDENWTLNVVDLKTGEERNLTPFKEVQVRVASVDEDTPTQVLVSINHRNPQLHDLYRVDITTGALDMVQECPEGVVEMVIDNDGRVRFGVKFTEEGGQQILERNADGTWTDMETIPQEDALTTGTIGFSKDNKTLYLQDSRGRDTAALYAIDLETRARTVVAESTQADMADVMVHPVTKAVQAVSFNRLRTEWTVLDDSIRADLVTLKMLGDGEIDITGRSQDDRVWLVALLDDNGPVRYYRYDRPDNSAPRKATFLFNHRDKLVGLKLAEMHPVVIKSRDGLDLVSYLSLPVESGAGGALRPTRPLPMVLLVHGGPWARDTWGYNGLHQLLANRGYAVLSVNYRGSTGFGKSFVNASNQEWGGKMHDDLIDAVDWAVRERIADPARVAIMGGSYGGYATLVGLTFTPDKFACGVDIVGPSNLVTLLESIPPYWKPVVSLWHTRLGNPNTPEGMSFLMERSPINKVDRIRKPLLIGQGARDPRVKQAESDQIVAAMQSLKIPVTYVLFPDEGHGFVRPANNLAFFGISEGFLAQHLGGRYEPLDGAVEKSSAQILAGADGVPGMSTPGGK